ncbi:helix-turn-helix domain-containing protein [Enterococcus faecalis]|uniref:helix-turn-helix domain-containing protein n=1 Tax=Enterococcus faecalis TaxID=1351 RepID=UPI00325A6884
MDEYTELTQLIIEAKKGDNQAMTELYQRFDYLLIKLSKDHKGLFDEDCYQILSERFIKAVRQFDIERI